MTTLYDKLIVTNRTALRGKYGTDGEQQIRDALTDLAEKDDARGLTSKVVMLDNGSSLRPAAAQKITDPADWAGAVRAVDLLWQRYQSSYVVLLGSADVVRRPTSRTRSARSVTIPTRLCRATCPTRVIWPTAGRCRPAGCSTRPISWARPGWSAACRTFRVPRTRRTCSI